MEKLLISACILGASSRYDGKSKKCLTERDLGRLIDNYELVPFCPEIYGGLPTPRTPSERVGDAVLMKDGKDVTENYKKGAMEAKRLCELLGIKKALLKERSPACGKDRIYDGSFTGVLTPRHGVAAELLIESGISVYGDSEIEMLFDDE
ncbi:MAG: DUF523 domain-containing protein [Clostridia bacterium]|nr:DUF523 domain-containing protein [Clostridia bacterium]